MVTQCPGGQSVISSLFRSLTGSKCQVSPSKQNGSVVDDGDDIKRSNSDAVSITSSKIEPPEKPPENKGEIFFWRNFGYDQGGRPFLKVNHDANMEETGHVLIQEWKLGTPRIVLVVMSNVSPLSQWTNTRQIKNFQKGLISATNTTEMWILTNGINVGVTKIIGDAVHGEINRRNSKSHFQKNHQSSDIYSKIIVIGVAREDLLNHGDCFDGSNRRVEIENEGNKIEEHKYDLNPDHTHFLIVKDGTINKTGINYFLLRLQHYLASSLDPPKKSASPYRLNRCSLGILEIPVVAVLFQGGTDCARLVLDHLKRHLPLVVMKGSGGLADILGFAYSEINQRPQGIADAEFCENYLKPELSRKITEKFPQLRDNSLSRNTFRDRIIDCIRCAKQIDKEFFDEAILRPQRESFVDLFLNQGFQVHKYLTPRRLILLFRKVRHQEFFQTICWEGALGYGPMSDIKRNFIETDLNWLIEKTTSMENFVSSQELSLNAMGMYCTDPSAAERKAKVLLTFWATYTNRILLAKTLWKHADQPIHLALVLSMVMERLSLYVMDTSLKAEMEEYSRDFADIATSMLDACYLDTPDRAFDVLNEESPGWGYNTAVDIAAEAKNKRFLSHICCQKWLTNEFFGKIKIRELSWGAFSVPISIKVLLCAFFIFPMYAWTIFQTKECISTEDDKDIVDFDSDNESDDKTLISDAQDKLKIKKWSVQRTWKAVMWNPSTFRRYVIHHPPLWKMIYLMWSAPITKFWTFQVPIFSRCAITTPVIAFPFVVQDPWSFVGQQVVLSMNNSSWIFQEWLVTIDDIVLTVGDVAKQFSYYCQLNEFYLTFKRILK
ncbi:transient receptor potential cation channel subfamily M member 5 [Caerostris darwini]|uniref:Transient receptor potential cation channel subfamily M member 5 n=1 Tax=Caerostris darwini TaxID=1538125 RepID=A0AAV4QEB7_9ARAC|nr:transient receptor potential cation channel subfamily M member 5 [Caerostris darwini]